MTNFSLKIFANPEKLLLKLLLLSIAICIYLWILSRFWFSQSIACCLYQTFCIWSLIDMCAFAHRTWGHRKLLWAAKQTLKVEADMNFADNFKWPHQFKWWLENEQQAKILIHADFSYSAASSEARGQMRRYNIQAADATAWTRSSPFAWLASAKIAHKKTHTRKFVLANERWHLRIYVFLSGKWGPS